MLHKLKGNACNTKYKTIKEKKIAYHLTTKKMFCLVSDCLRVDVHNLSLGCPGSMLLYLTQKRTGNTNFILKINLD